MIGSVFIVLSGVVAFSCSKELSPAQSLPTLQTQTRVKKTEIIEKKVDFYFHREKKCSFVIKGSPYYNYWLLPAEDSLRPEFAHFIHREHKNGISELNGYAAIHDICGMKPENLIKLLKISNKKAISIDFCPDSMIFFENSVLSELGKFENVGLTSLPASPELAMALSKINKKTKLHLDFRYFNEKNIRMINFFKILKKHDNIYAIYLWDGLEEDDDWNKVSEFPELKDFYFYGPEYFKNIYNLLKRSIKIQRLRLEASPGNFLFIDKSTHALLEKVKYSDYTSTINPVKDRVFANINKNNIEWSKKNLEQILNIKYLYIEFDDLNQIVFLINYMPFLQDLSIKTKKCSQEDLNFIGTKAISRLRLECDFSAKKIIFKKFNSLKHLNIIAKINAESIDISKLRSLKSLVISPKNNKTSFVLPDNIEYLEIKGGKPHKSWGNLTALKHLVIDLDFLSGANLLLTNQSIVTLSFKLISDISKPNQQPIDFKLMNLKYIRFRIWESELSHSFINSIFNSLKNCPALETVNLFGLKYNKSFQKFLSTNHLQCTQLKKEYLNR